MNLDAKDIGFFDLNAEQQEQLFLSEPNFRRLQFFEWLFQKRTFLPEHMTNLSKSFQQKLTPYFKHPHLKERIDSHDGSTKLLLGQSSVMETVILRYKERTSLCISTQVGCRLGCRFCQTGKLGFFKNLSVHDIMSQFYYASSILAEESRRISHVVFMGMGEPFDNYKVSIEVANILIEKIGISAKHVTISTSGIAPKIISMAEDTRAALAVSLHAADDKKRSELMPINTRYPLATLKDALMTYQKRTKRLVTLEYILIDGVNTHVSDAKRLVSFIHGLRAKVNLIPFNAHPGMPYVRPNAETIRQFQSYLAERSVPSPVRYSLGLDISAACGQLAAKNKEALGDKPQRQTLKDLIKAPTQNPNLQTHPSVRLD